MSATTARAPRSPTPAGLTAAPDGSVYVHRLGMSVGVYRIAGRECGNAGRGDRHRAGATMETASRRRTGEDRRKSSNTAIVMAPECDGGFFYFTDYQNQRVRWVDGEGDHSHDSRDGVCRRRRRSRHATNTFAINSPESIAVAPDGSVYTFVNGACRASGTQTESIVRLDTDGTASYVVSDGCGTVNNIDGIPASQTWINASALGLAVGADETLYFGENSGIGGFRIRVIPPSGIVTTIAGVPTSNSSPAADGSPISSIRSSTPFRTSRSPPTGPSTSWSNLLM